MFFFRSISSAVGLVLIIGTMIAAIIITGCSTVPVSGRRRVLAVSETKENQLGLTAYREILEKEPISGNERYKAMVNRVGQRIAAVADRSDFDWEFNVIESETQNAFCLPGGKVAVYTGMLPVCRTEAGLAVVMSHEIAHAIARHGGERMTHKNVQTLGKTGIGMLLENQDEQKKDWVLTVYSGSSEYLGILPYSRKHELEADAIGLRLMAQAGYDPSTAPVFWERFAAIKGVSGPVEFLSTHPSDSRRSAKLREQLPAAMQIYEQAPEQFALGESIESE